MWTVIGHSKQKIYFENALKGGFFGHAYIFSGLGLIGKKKFAIDLYAIANSRNINIDPDLKIVSVKDDESSISVETAREIKQFYSLTPHTGPYKFLIIDNAEKLTTEASNALLKIIEEPPKSAVMILITSKPKILLDTIRSRCHIINFSTQSAAEIDEYLKDKEIPQDDKNFITRISSNRIGKVIDIISGKRLEDIRHNISDFEEVMGQGDFEKIQYAKKILEEENYADIFDDIISYYSSDTTANQTILRGLLDLNKILVIPQFNHRLALENFLLNSH